MIRNFLLIGVMTMFCPEAFSQQYLPPKIFNQDSLSYFSLVLPEGIKTNLHASKKQLLVVAFLSPECPVCKNYSSKLDNIKKKYNYDADFVGIVPGSFNVNEVVEFKKNYMPSWLILRDTSLKLTHYLEGEVTPEVLVIDNRDGVLIYKGAIDNWMVSLGKTRNKVTNFYLDVSLNNFLNNKPSIPFTKPVGCIINDF